MSNEIHPNFPSGYTLYAIVRNSAGNVWYVAGQVFEAWGTGSRDADDYDIAMVDKSGSRYVGDFDTNIPAGTYSIQIFRQAGASPADTDRFVGGFDKDFRWSGTAQRKDVESNIALSTTIASVTTADTVFKLTAGATDNDAYNNMVISIEDVSSGEIRSRRVTDYIGGSNFEVTVDYDFQFAIAVGDIVKIYAGTYSQTADAATIDDIFNAIMSGNLSGFTTPQTLGYEAQQEGHLSR